MKKSLFLFATAALVLAACSSEDDIVQNAPQKAEAQANAVMFDTYTATATRAGDPAGVMTTDKLKTTGKGFGVFAVYQDGVDYAASTKTPNFMFNEHVHWASGWTYEPLKYWPNETTKDSQDPAATAAQKDKLSFFAYAPYVSESATLTTKDASTLSLDGGTTHISAYHASETSGISAISSETYNNDPVVEYKVSSDPDNNVDLLWGVAPAGMSYTDVSGSTTSAPVGMPLKDMVKPDKDQKMKFLFQHALSRIGLSVVSAIDQIAAGDDGGKYTTDQTRVLIQEVKIWGDFGISGVLNLNNTSKNVANWIEASVDRTASDEGSPQFTITGANGRLAPDLRYDATQITTIAGDASAFTGLKEGVLPSEKPLMVGGPDPNTKVGDAPSTPAFEWGKTYYYFSDPDYLLASVSHSNTADLYTYDEAAGKYTQAYTTANTSITLDGKSAKLYTIIESAAVTSGTALTSGTKNYWHKEGTAGNITYTLVDGDGVTLAGTNDYYPVAGFSGSLITVSETYASKQYWTALLPRYFMVIPSTLPYVEGTTETTINVKITYRVVTKDTKLTGNVSNVSNAITKETKIQLESGKSYNLKLILGLTSVKLDATVADWLVADDAEIWLPKNNE